MTGRGLLLSAAFALAFGAVARPAFAQSSSIEIGVGGAFTGSASAGSTDATLLDPAGEPLRLFRTTNRIGSGWAIEGLVSSRLTDKVRLELALGWGSAEYETQISSDFEDVPAATATHSVNQFTAELGLAWRVIERESFDVFLRGAGGGFREITSDRALVDNGWRASVGGGAHFRLRDGAGWFGRMALRTDVRLQARGKGIAFGSSATRWSPVVFAGLVFGH